MPHQMESREPNSCDTFVVLPPLTKHGIIFGKNSDRDENEVQEVVYIPSYESIDSMKCTYIEVEGAGPTKATILSKPNWMWGAEMGANESGVVIGNEAIWTNDNDGEHNPNVKRLLGMDLVRLGLERSSSATEALEVITQLLEKYGQGGPCSNTDTSLAYHNSFMICDPTTAWILETSGKHWAAEQVCSGYRNISNCMSITTKIDRHSEGLQNYAKSKGFWDGQGEFNFSEAFTGNKQPDGSRYQSGKQLLEKCTSSNFRETDMFKILRDTESGICMTSGLSAGHVTQGSQDPHTLYTLHSAAIKKGNQVQELLRNMEEECVEELESVIERIGDDLTELDELLKDCVETEVKFYR